MYEYIIGKYKGINKEYIIIENNGIGYKVYTSGNTMAKMPKVDEEVKVFLIQIVREDFIGLYGFSTMEELELFNKLITINGVGAKASLSLLSISNVDNLKYAIVNEHDKTLTKAPGIGKKIAQRIILELKDKLEIRNDDDTMDESDLMNTVMLDHKKLGEAASALMALGYSEKEADKAIKSVDSDLDLEDIIKQSLKFLMN